jgi:hypothetical protein
MLRRLANSAGTIWCQNGRKKKLLNQAKKQALLELWQRDRNDTDRRDAYSGAIGKMFNSRSHHAKRQRTTGKAEAKKPTGIDPTLIGLDAKGQYLLLI